MPNSPARFETKTIDLPSGVQLDVPSELSLLGKCCGFDMRDPPSVSSARYDPMCSVHLRKATRFPSAVALTVLTHDPDQDVSRFGTSTIWPEKGSTRMVQ